MTRDYIYQVDFDDYSDDKIRLHRAKVTRIGAKQVFVDGRTGLAFSCRTRFRIDEVHWTPAAAEKAFRVRMRREARQAQHDLNRANEALRQTKITHGDGW